MTKTTKRSTSKSQKKNKMVNNRRSQQREMVVFDEAARADYLRGFHKRKVQRRTYGLAHQALKDRNSKLETKRERKIAQLEEIERSEQQKKELLVSLQQAADDDIEDDNDNRTDDDEQQQNDPDDNESTNEEDKPITYVEMYQDDQEQWGGNVIVTTSTQIPDDDEDLPRQSSKKPKTCLKHDTEQEYAGSLQKYMHKIKANLPKKKRANNLKRKGQHGATKSIGGTDMKTAQKALNMAKSTLHKKNQKRKR